MYRYPDEINWQAHFWFDRKLIASGIWASLPKASRSIFPIIGCHRNEHGLSFPAERTMAILCGRTDKTVREGVRGLAGLYNLKILPYITSRGRRSKKFYLVAPPREPGRAFPFYRCLLEKGLWQELSPAAQSLYPVMRHFGFFDSQTYREWDDPDFQEQNFDQVYRERDFDYCEAEMLQLLRHAGLARPSLAPALASLEQNALVEPVDRDPNGRPWLWRVRFKTQSWFPRELLNRKIRERYGRQ
ncbi:MAG: hypothetical protein BWK76_09580 [Desulfobulbaceae bacterium A2]|nr:MAG: hypothetical protein BWK76_09580 [Desulfobulbaceae bacterium A2]